VDTKYHLLMTFLFFKRSRQALLTGGSIFFFSNIWRRSSRSSRSGVSRPSTTMILWRLVVLTATLGPSGKKEKTLSLFLPFLPLLLLSSSSPPPLLLLSSSSPPPLLLLPVFLFFPLVNNFWIFSFFSFLFFAVQFYAGFFSLSLQDLQDVYFFISKKES
jgi:hypothetical protein